MATIPMKLVPFDVPTVVYGQMPPGRREDGIRPSPIYRLEDLPHEVVATLINEFAESVLNAWQAKQPNDVQPFGSAGSFYDGGDQRR